MGRITTEQSHEIMAALATNTNWRDVDFSESGLQDSVIRNSRQAGREFAAFLRSGCSFRGIVELLCIGRTSIKIPALPRPTLKEIQRESSYLDAIKIERDTSPTNEVTLRLATILRLGEDSVDGCEEERRMLLLGNRALGYQHRNWLVDNQDKFSAFTAFLGTSIIGHVSIVFPGIVVVTGGGCPHKFGMTTDSRWRSYSTWVGDGFGLLSRVAISD